MRPPVSLHWHAESADTVATALGTTLGHGLPAAAVAERRAEFGANRLPAPDPVTLRQVILHQFTSPLIYVLLAAAGVAAVLRDFVDAGFIVAIVLINAALGAFQEWRAEQSAASLHELLQIQARVRREGREFAVAADELVPGDVVILESGNRVPADARLAEARDLSVDESMLTGESVAVEKLTRPLHEALGVGDRRNMVFAGATVTSGRATAIVVATGARTEVGAIARSVTDTAASKPPLAIRMEEFAGQISIVVLVACMIVGGIGFASGISLVEVFFLSVALAVSAIPEGLPVAVTVTLSIATVRMARRRVIVRRLVAVEGLGSCTCIATDKTGTLTVNRQTVRRIVLAAGDEFAVTGEGYDPAGEVRAVEAKGGLAADNARLLELAAAVVLCNEAGLQQGDAGWEHSGDAVDVALLTLAHKLGLDPAAVRADVRVTGAIPFESERAHAAVFYERGGEHRVAVKGALETLLPWCTTMRTRDGGEAPLDAALIEAQAEELASDGHRFLLIAEGTVPEGAGGRLPPLTLLGLVGLIDPARPEARSAVELCGRAGIKVVMITGDHPLTALAIARDVGIAVERDEVVTGALLADIGDPESPAYDALVRGGRVFARVTPLDKLHIVAALQRAGEIVAVTGDGVNDAPALRRADIGVAMGSGADVAKDTAALIVTDDNFASIEAGVEEGRIAYDNIRKVTYLLISTGAAEVLLLLGALIAGLPIPLVAVQLLWLNLVTNGIQDVSLAFEAGESSAMRRPPRRPSEGIFDRQMIRQSAVSGVTMAGLALFQWWGLLRAGVDPEAARNQLLLLFVLLQNVHVFNCRSERASAFAVPLRRNPVLAVGVPAALGVHVLAMHVPLMQRILGIAPLAAHEWLMPAALALTLLVVMELVKRFVWRER